MEASRSLRQVTAFQGLRPAGGQQCALSLGIDPRVIPAQVGKFVVQLIKLSGSWHMPLLSCERSFSSVTPDDDLNVAMIAFTVSESDEVPVVDSTRKRVMGILHYNAAISAYNRRLLELKATAAQHS